VNKYRAILIDPANLKQERPLQIFGNDRTEIDNWGAKVLRQAISPDAVVLIYQQTEVQVAMICKRKESA
jgi:hypothetical protein